MALGQALGSIPRWGDIYVRSPCLLSSVQPQWPTKQERAFGDPGRLPSFGEARAGASATQVVWTFRTGLLSGTSLRGEGQQVLSPQHSLGLGQSSGSGAIGVDLGHLLELSQLLHIFTFSPLLECIFRSTVSFTNSKPLLLTYT